MLPCTPFCATRQQIAGLWSPLTMRIRFLCFEKHVSHAFAAETPSEPWHFVQSITPNHASGRSFAVRRRSSIPLVA